MSDSTQQPQDGGETQTDTPGATIPSDARSLVATCFSLLAAKAWEALGLVPNPETKQIHQNLGDAQFAIDAAAALAAVIRDRCTDAERREIDTLLANLRINFVEQKSKAP